MTARKILLMAIVSIGLPLYAQEPTPVDTMEYGSFEEEKILEDITQDITDSQLVDALARLEENPLDLNSATESELQMLPGITSILALKIVSWRLEHPFVTVEDLIHVDGMTDELYLGLRKYVTVSVARTLEPSKLSVWFRSRNSSFVEKSLGYQDGSYLGSPLKSYNRFVARYGEVNLQPPKGAQSLELGFLTEKDPGEEKFNDFSAGYLLANIRSLSSRIILGDYVVEAAEGLVLWRSVGFSKGSEVIAPIQKNGRGLRPYLSTDENLFFRGAAMEISTDDISISLFHSNKPLSASINADGSITSVASDGYHRTSSEVAKKNNSSEKISGFRFKMEPSEGFVVGATAYNAMFGNPVSLNESSVNADGRLTAGGVDVSFTNQSVSVFSEIARSGGGSAASVLGIIYEPTNQLDLAFHYRSYPNDFVNLHAFGFRETGTLTQNESGVYVGAKASISRRIRVAMYYDQYHFPWRSSTMELPSAGNDFLLSTEGNVFRGVKVQLLYRNKNKPSSFVGIDAFDRQIDVVGMRNQRNYRITVDFASSQLVDWRSRFEAVNVSYSVNNPSAQGFLWMQDGRFRIHEGFTLDARVIIFQTDSFDSRLYEFEDDLQGTFSNPSLFGRGLRWYVLAKYKIANYLAFSCKYARTVKDGVRTMGSGPNQIVGDSEDQFSFQVDVVF